MKGVAGPCVFKIAATAQPNSSPAALLSVITATVSNLVSGAQLVLLIAFSPPAFVVAGSAKAIAASAAFSPPWIVTKSLGTPTQSSGSQTHAWRNMPEAVRPINNGVQRAE